MREEKINHKLINAVETILSTEQEEFKDQIDFDEMRLSWLSDYFYGNNLYQL